MAEAKSFYVIRLQRANLNPKEGKLQEGRWALLRGRNFQALTLVKHEAGGLLRQRAGWLEPEKEQRPATCQKYHQGEKSDPDVPSQLQDVVILADVHLKGQELSLSRLIYARPHTSNMYIM